MSAFKPKFPGDSPFAAAVRAGCDAQGIRHGLTPPPALGPAREAFRAARSPQLAATYLRALLLYWEDDRIDDSTLSAGIDEIGAYLSNPWGSDNG